MLYQLARGDMREAERIMQTFSYEQCIVQSMFQQYENYATSVIYGYT